MGKGAASHPVTKSLPKASKTWPGTRKCESCLPKGQAGIQDFSTPNLTKVRDWERTNRNEMIIGWTIHRKSAMLQQSLEYFLYSYMRIKCSEHAPIFSYWWSLLTNQLLIANKFVKLHGNQHNNDLHILEIHNQFLGLSSFSFSYFLSWEYSSLACHVLCQSFPERCA